ncbi:hypothetical protein CASFOL_030446 [Castilleja foliolosa]|uniref:Protein kinase domain-containing protein n=1 Tax=Castilleja foliolosa TaxID=1961234 RepID=A0ABD3C8M9_9LAMI
MMGSGFWRFSIRVLLVLLNLLYCSRGFDPDDRYYINCGSSTDFVLGNFTYVSDNPASGFLSTPQNILADNGNSNSVTPSDNSPLYRTARIFTGPSRYTFSISRAGRHWIRLHFYPFVYQTYNMSTASFSVFAQQTTLLTDFTPQNISVLREYSINAARGDLIITFSPSATSFAFVNALELVSAPDNLITDDASLVNPPGPFTGLVTRALETVARVNMGGPSVSLTNDTLGRTWVPDRIFLLIPALATNASNIPAVQYPQSGASPETAPQTVYGTCARMNSAGNPLSNFNVTWGFQVDTGFQYFIRLHFCDIVSASANELLFNVYVGTFLVARDFELSSNTGGRLAVPYFLDFVTPTLDTRNLTISIGPSPRSGYPNALLNGLEIMKISNSRNRLSGTSVLPRFPGSKGKNVWIIVSVCVGVLAALATVLVLLFMRRRRKRARRAQSKTWIPILDGTTSHTMGSKYSTGAGGIDSGLSYRIPLLSILEATNTFDESLIIGDGGFGKVYKGVFSNGTKVAVKRGNPQSHQGLVEFRTEIEMLSQFRHRHLVSLIGYCDEKNEMILVYEYMENGTLKSHLYGSDYPSLGWKERLEICIGAARGLHYLHTGYAKAVIHRDVKSANILIDENFMAKVADFGLSKTGPELDQTHVSTAVKGSFGYLDPEYFRRQQLTDKSDVYSFGVVLFEVLCARPVIDPSLAREMVNMAEWAMRWQKKGQLDQIVDHNLAGKVRPESLRKFGETAEKCLADFGVDRPSMGDVLWNLEYALQLQESVVRDHLDENSANAIGQISPRVDELDNNNNNNNVDDDDDDDSAVLFESSSTNMDDLSMSRVFSQMVKSEGR